MAKIPTPLSYQQLLGDMLDAFLSKYGITSVKVGGPILSIFESAAQSDFRNSLDTFSLLASKSLDNASGIALDRIGQDEEVPRITQASASVKLTFVDSSFEKVATTLNPSYPAPIVGSTVIQLADATGFPGAPDYGSVYIGKGSNNFEGPIAYNAVNGNALTLTTPTRRFHNIGEQVLLAQGGERAISGGTVVKTTRSSTLEAIEFSTLYRTVIADGETTIENVEAIAVKPGADSNCGARAIDSFQSVPFAGCTVTNPLPVTNGRDTESDTNYRERIRAARSTRTKGTRLAILNSVINAVAADESARVTSSSLSVEPNGSAKLYIDDGTGYEAKTEAIPMEVLVDRASGGEQYFQLANSPVAKAFVTTDATAPFALTDDIVAATARGYVAKLAVKVGGVVSEHSFIVDDFTSPSNASAYEIAASINSNPDLLFNAGTVESGLGVKLFARGDTGEYLEVVAASDSANDAQDVLQFTGGVFDTVNLYKNDVLLNKDGQLASLTSLEQDLWDTMSGSVTLIISIDGTNATTFTITDADFARTNTSYAAVSNGAPLTVWAQVFNNVIPGITATVVNGRLVLTSNKGRNSGASLAITGGTLVTGDMFEASESFGADSDYELNKATGQIKLNVPLAAGDRLTAGTTATNAFVESREFDYVSFADAAEMWLVVDADVERIPSTLSSSTSLSWGYTSRSHGYDIDITSAVDLTVFANVAVGDYAFLWDSAFGSCVGAWRVSQLTNSINLVGFTFERGVAGDVPAASGTLLALTQAGLTFVRTDAAAKRITIAAGDYSPDDIVDAINAQVTGITAEVVNGKVRLYTNTPGLTGKITVAARNLQAAQLGFPLTEDPVSVPRHTAVVESNSGDLSSPMFAVCAVSSVDAVKPKSTFDFSGTANTVETLFAPRQVNTAGEPRYSSNCGQYRSVNSISGSTIELASDLPAEIGLTDRLVRFNRFGIGPQDTLSVLVDNDTVSKRYSASLFRRVAAVGDTYSSSIALRDLDNLDVNGNPQALGLAFGTSFDFSDFAIYMHSRCKSHIDPGDNTSTILWRLKDMEVGNAPTTIRYEYPLAPSTGVVVEQSYSTTDATKNLVVRLPSGEKADLGVLRPTMKIGTLTKTVYESTRATFVYVVGLDISGASRTNGTTTLTLSLPSGVTDHGLTAGNVIYLKSNNSDFPSGAYTVAASPAPTDNAISYVDVAGLPNKTGTTIGYITVDASLATAADFEFPIVTGNILSVALSTGIGANPGVDSKYKYHGVITTSTNRLMEVGVNYTSTITATSPAKLYWRQLIDTSGFVAYPLDTANCTIDAIAASVNALPNCPVTALAIGTGADHSGSVTQASWKEASSATKHYDFSNGVQYVKSVSVVGNEYTLTFKDATISDASLLLNADWANEEIRLVPSTAKNMVDFLNVPSVTGLSSSAIIRKANNSGKLTIESNTVGSAGSVKVESGTGNVAVATVIGIASAVANTVLSITKSSAAGFATGNLLQIQNQFGAPKGAFDATTVVTNVTNNTDTFELKVSPAQQFSELNVTDDNVEFQVAKYGDFACYSATNNGPATIGYSPLSALHVATSTSTYSNMVSAANCGWFRPIKVDSSTKAFWVYNPNAIEETVYMKVREILNFVTATNAPIVPGDKLVISSAVCGAQLVGTWDIVDVGFDGNYVTSLIVAKGGRTIATTTPGVTLGANAAFFKVLQNPDVKVFKRIANYGPSSADANVYELVLDDNNSTWEIGESYGTIITAIDKLAFPTDTIMGVDAYKRYTGLIAEANRIVYGDPLDSITYPGVAAIGAQIEVTSPVVRRIKLSLAIRSKYTDDVLDRVRSAVAAVINQSPIGKPIAISDILAAANSVGCVTSVAIIEPDYSATNDQIMIQASEKPMVLDLENDIQISFIGE